MLKKTDRKTKPRRRQNNREEKTQSSNNMDVRLGQFHPKYSNRFPLEFSTRFGEKEFWRARRENYQALPFSSLISTPNQTHIFFYHFYFLSIIFYPSYFTSIKWTLKSIYNMLEIIDMCVPNIWFIK